MKPSRRDFLRIGGAAVAAAAVGSAVAPAWAQPPQQTPALGDPALHLLNRITWGARPEEVERARAIGLTALLEEQLHPEQIDDSALDERLQKMPILLMDRDTAAQLIEPYGRTYQALTEGMIVRAAHSQRQLLERMVEFWSDHFNIPSGELSIELIPFQREAIRANALGKFRDMLFATAHSPAMLYYLDNYLNIAEHPNENYARELLELHTLGVDGGYTESDVKEVARAFTGWTVSNATSSGFWFDASVHDTGEKFVLGHTLPADRGIEDGLHVLSIVVNHPSTAYFICRKLCVRFVSDNPPQSLVESAAAVWMESGGEIVPVLRHIFQSVEFFQSAGQKFRRPLDFFIGALRATGTEIHDFWRLNEMLEDLAQVPYGWQPPNGYPDAAGAWINSGGLLARWNAGMALTHNAFSDYEDQKIMTTRLRDRIGQPETVGELVDAVAWQVFASPLPDSERGTFIAFVTEDGDPAAPITSHMLASKLATLYGLMLTSPLYQWR